ncbi:MAG: ABC transporter permease, partial [Desulfofustis sp.]|nr:ABC transporter permease [Desulfofustis sp.]
VSLYTGISSMALLGFMLYMVLDRIEQHVCRWMSDR